MQPKNSDTLKRKRIVKKSSIKKSSSKLCIKIPRIKNTKIQISDFEPIQVLGIGGFGKVILARKITGSNSGKLFAVKELNKSYIVKKRQVFNILAEEKILKKISKKTYLVKMHYSFQSTTHLYMALDYLPGGDLFYHKNFSKPFTEKTIRFYISELVLALKSLHEIGIIYRDLKPENIILDIKGHLQLVDFGLSTDKVFSATKGCQHLCGTIHYVAPEMLFKNEYGTGVDWWSLGIIMYELFYKAPPWYSKDNNIEKMIQKLSNEELVFTTDSKISLEAIDLIRKLLNKDQNKRIGCGQKRHLEVMEHPFFAGVVWEKLSISTPPFESLIEDLTENPFIDPIFKSESPTFGQFQNEITDYKYIGIANEAFQGYFESSERCSCFG